MAKKEATDKKGRLLWIEPNKIDSLTETGTFDYEDYCITVDLEVKIPKRNACGSEDELITFHVDSATQNDKISFFTGTDGYLTTSFTDIIGTDPTSNKETLGIESLDITYNSYFYPQVTIKFVDVRGSSLMYPQEDMFKNGSQGSFFKALFSFPYPRFTLKVKGFYGKMVNYELAVEDFRTAFNPTTGNFECTVKFIGYMYGIYADLPMAYIAVSPYDEYHGAKYWKQKIDQGIFVYDDDNGSPTATPLHTFIDLNYKIRHAESEISKVMQNDENVKEKNKLVKESEYLMAVDDAFQRFKTSTNEGITTSIMGDYQLVIYSSSPFVLKNVSIAQWGFLNLQIKNYNTNFNSTTLPYINGLNSSITNELYNALINIGYEAGENESIKAKEYTTEKFKESLTEGHTEITKLKNLINETEDIDKYYAFVFNLNGLNKNISERLTLIDTKVKDLSAIIEDTKKTIFAESLGFKPSLQNIFKIIFAHIDTFMESYYHVLNKIGPNRDPKDYGIDSKNSDIIGDILPPYPLVTRKDPGKNPEAIWPGDYTPAKGMEELKFAIGLLNGVKLIESEMIEQRKRAEAMGASEGVMDFLSLPTGGDYISNTSSNVNIVPTHISDFRYFTNPYTHFIEKDNLKLHQLWSYMGLRLLPTIYNNVDGSGFYVGFGKFEAVNFYKNIPSLNKMDANEGEIIRFIENIASGDTNALNDFYSYLRNEENYLKKQELSIPWHKDAILSGDTYVWKGEGRMDLPVFQNGNINLQTIVNSKESSEFFPDIPFTLQDIDSSALSFFNDVYHRVKTSSTAQIEDHYVEWYGKYVKNMFDYNTNPTKDSESYVDTLLKSLIVGINNSFSYDNYYTTFNGKVWESDFTRSGLIMTNFYGMYYEEGSNFTPKSDSRYLHQNEHLNKNFGNKLISGYSSAYIASNFPMKQGDFIVKHFKHKNINTVKVIDPSCMAESSLYGSKIFYAQDNIFSKAYLFLESCAPCNSECFNYQKNAIKTKWDLLLIGARLWRYEESEEPISVKDCDCSIPGKESPLILKLAERMKGSTVEKRYFVTGSGPYASGHYEDFTGHIPMMGVAPYSSKEPQETIETYFKGDLSIKDSGLTDENNVKGKEFFINYFKQWVNEEFVYLNEELELKFNNDSRLTPNDIKGLLAVLQYDANKEFEKKDFIKKIEDNKIVCPNLKKVIESLPLEKYNTFNLIKEIFKNSKAFRNYAFIERSFESDNVNHFQSGFFLYLDPESEISQVLFNKKFEFIVYNVIKETCYNTKINDWFKESVKAFCTTLKKLYESNSGYINPYEIEVDGSVVSDATHSKDLSLSLYLTLKNLYDRWLCGLKRERWSIDYYLPSKYERDKAFDTGSKNPDNQKYIDCEFNKFYFIDSFYNDIGKKGVINLNDLKFLIDSIVHNRVGDSELSPNGMKFQGISVYQFMASALQKNSMLFLAVPCFNTYKNVDDIKELFTPYSWFDRGYDRGTSYVGIYPHKVSEHLDLQGGSEYQYPNDSFDIADVNGIINDVEIDDLLNMDGGYTMPAFGVTYAKQDQTYFKRVTVNMDNPQVTEYSIGATLDIANKYASHQKVQTFVGQDLYKVYSNHSYTCTVEMMGNAMITPLMYFQLNNIPMFRGAYMVIKVEHNITQGNMITTFTGVRIAKNKLPIVSEPTIEGVPIDDVVLRNGDGSTNDGGAVETPAIVVEPGTPEEISSNIEKMLGYARAAIGIIEYGYDINKKQSEQILYDENTAPNGWRKDYVPYPTINGEPYGIKDPDGIYKPIQSHTSGVQWCCIFVSWCAMRAGISPELSTGANGWYRGENWDNAYVATCDALWNYYSKQEGRTIELNEENLVNNPPQSGDYLLKKSDKEGKQFKHVAIVESYNAETKTITIIHGNSFQRVKRENITYDDAKGIYTYYCRPFYAGNASSVVKEQPYANPIYNTSSDELKKYSDDIILRSKEDKIRLINAFIWQESWNNHKAIGDTHLENSAYGILQIRRIMYQEIRNERKTFAKSGLLGPSEEWSGNGDPEDIKGLSREKQVQGYIAVMEYRNQPNNEDNYLKNKGPKTAESIPWSMRWCCSIWNCGNKNKKCDKYFNEIKEKYNNLLAKESCMPKPQDRPDWTVNEAFEDFFSGNFVAK